MNAPWFDANMWAWLPGTMYGCLLGVWGSCAGMLAPMGKARSLVLGSCIVFTVVAAAFLVTAVIAIATGQPYGIWYGFLLPGILGMILCPMFYPLMRKRYREAEERRMHAADFR